MKQVLTLLFIITISSSSYCQSNTVKDGDACFSSGNYTCAINKYTEAVKSLEGRDKQIAEINLGRAKTCAEWLKNADQAFYSGNFWLAKEDYQSVVNENPTDTYAIYQLERCKERLNLPSQPALRKATTLELTDIWNNKYGNFDERRRNLIKAGIDPDDAQRRINQGEGKPSTTTMPGLRKATTKDLEDIWNNKYGTYQERRQNLIKAGIDPDDAQRRINQGEGKPQAQPMQATTLSVSKSALSFPSSGGSSGQIMVYTNESDYEIQQLPYWCSVQKFSGYIIVACSPNTSSKQRSDWFRISAGNKMEIITLSQSGIEKAQEPSTSLSISKDNVYFLGSGGESGPIKVYTKGYKYEVSLVPSWCKVKTYGEYFIITCLPNKSKQSRSNWFKVSISNEELIVTVRQGGKEKKKK